MTTTPPLHDRLAACPRQTVHRCGTNRLLVQHRLPAAFATTFVLAILSPTICLAQVNDAVIAEIRREIQVMKDELRASKEREAALQKKVTSLEAKAAAPAKKEEAKAKKVGADAESQATAAFEKASTDPTLNFSTPDAPAAAVLGIAPEKVIHAATPKQLVLTAINGLDDKGHFQTGFAVDFAPAQLFAQRYWAEKYRDRPERAGGFFTGYGGDYMRAVMNRTQFSFAAIRGTEAEDESSKLALGVNISLMDAEDPLVGGPVRTGEPGAGVDLAFEAGEDALNPEFVYRGPFVDEGLGWWGNLLYRHASWSVGGAATWLSVDPEEEDYEYAGATVWSTFTFSFSRMGEPKAPYRLLAHFRYDDQQQIAAGDAILPPLAGVDPVTGAPIPAPAFVDQDSLLAVGAFRLGRKDFNATGSIAYVKRWQRSSGSGEEDSLIYAVSAEKRIGKGPMWITLSAGQEVGGSNDGNTIILGGVRLGFGGSSFGTEEPKEL